MQQFPVFLTVKDRPVLIIGGGETAARKLRLVGRAGPKVTVIAPSVCDELRKLADAGEIVWQARAFEAADVDGCALVYGATEIDAIDLQVSKAARAAGVPVNVVDRPELSDFITPAIVDRSPIVVAVSSGGAAPILIRNIRATIDRLLPQGLGRLATFADRFRGAVKAVVPEGRPRLRFWETFFDGPVAERVLAGDEKGASEDMLALVNRTGAQAEEAGTVYIVGAGPGDADLLTIRAQRLLHQADVIVYDKLVSPDVMEMARRDADRIYVGKSKGRHTLPQDEINQVLVREAQAGKRVVRLKGGDPFIFGRGGEEMETVRAAGIRCEIVPGITAATACAASTGVPLTHRGKAAAVTFLTGHGKDGEPDIDWTAVARGKQTLAVYMGVGNAPRIAGRLIEHGMLPTTPVAVVENGARPDQRLVTATVATLGNEITRSGIKGPALIIIGEVASLANAQAPNAQGQGLAADNDQTTAQTGAEQTFAIGA